MPIFRVMEYKSAVSNKKDHIEVEAATAKEAAEKVVNRLLDEDGPIGRLRAQVYEVGIMKVKKIPFYDPHGYSED